MKITITNAYTWYNKGDAGILLATVEILKKLYPNSEFDILSFTPEEDSKRYCKIKEIKNVYSNILNPHPYKHTTIGKIIAIIKLFFLMIKTQIMIKIKKSNFKNKTLSSLEKSDMIIVCGGGFLGGKKIDSLMHLYQIYINTCFKKPVYIIGTSIEPIHNKVVKKITDKVLNKVDYVFAREIITEDYLKQLLPQDKYCLIPDIAFYLEDKKNCVNYFDKYRVGSKILLGITVRKWNFPQIQNKKKVMNNYVDSICNMMMYFIDKYSCTFIFIPQVIVEYANDTDIAQIIKNKLDIKYRKNFIIRTDDWSPYEIKEAIGELDGFIGTRMHSNIFATSKHVPTVAIAYEKKTNGIMHTLELDDYIVEINDITSDELIKKVESMISNKKSISDHLEKKIITIKREIYEKTKKHIKGD